MGRGKGLAATPDRKSTDALVDLFESHRLSPVQRRIAQFMLANVEETLYLSGSDLAQRVGVSQPSVTRFAIALGFEGYPALRHFLRSLIAASSRESTKEPVNKYEDLIGSEIRNLEALRTTLPDIDRLRWIGEQLANASPLIVLGLRASSPVAAYFHYFASKSHPDVRLNIDGGSRLYDLLLQWGTPAAWMVCFALPRYPRETVDAIDFAKHRGMRVAVITDDRLAPISGRADIVLAAQVATRTIFDSQAAPLVVANLLVEALCDADETRTEQRLEEFEHMAAAHQIFWDGS